MVTLFATRRLVPGMPDGCVFLRRHSRVSPYLKSDKHELDSSNKHLSDDTIETIPDNGLRPQRFSPQRRRGRKGRSEFKFGVEIMVRPLNGERRTANAAPNFEPQTPNPEQPAKFARASKEDAGSVAPLPWSLPNVPGVSPACSKSAPRERRNAETRVCPDLPHSS